jgi:hypothetical protein
MTKPYRSEDFKPNPKPAPFGYWMAMYPTPPGPPGGCVIEDELSAAFDAFAFIDSRPGTSCPRSTTDAILPTRRVDFLRV